MIASFIASFIISYIAYDADFDAIFNIASGDVSVITPGKYSGVT